MKRMRKVWREIKCMAARLVYVCCYGDQTLGRRGRGSRNKMQNKENHTHTHKREGRRKEERDEKHNAISVSSAALAEEQRERGREGEEKVQMTTNQADEQQRDRWGGQTMCKKTHLVSHGDKETPATVSP